MISYIVLFCILGILSIGGNIVSNRLIDKSFNDFFMYISRKGYKLDSTNDFNFLKAAIYNNIKIPNNTETYIPIINLVIAIRDYNANVSNYETMFNSLINDGALIPFNEDEVKLFDDKPNLKSFDYINNRSYIIGKIESKSFVTFKFNEGNISFITAPCDSIENAVHNKDAFFDKYNAHELNLIYDFGVAKLNKITNTKSRGLILDDDCFSFDLGCSVEEVFISYKMGNSDVLNQVFANCEGYDSNKCLNYKINILINDSMMLFDTDNIGFRLKESNGVFSSLEFNKHQFMLNFIMLSVMQSYDINEYVKINEDLITIDLSKVDNVINIEECDMDNKVVYHLYFSDGSISYYSNNLNEVKIVSALGIFAGFNIEVLVNFINYINGKFNDKFLGNLVTEIVEDDKSIHLFDLACEDIMGAMLGLYDFDEFKNNLKNYYKNLRKGGN